MKWLVSLLMLWPCAALSDDLPDGYELRYREASGAMVIEVEGTALRWEGGAWSGLALVDPVTGWTESVTMEEDGPPPDELIGFAPAVPVCGRDLAVATFTYAPDALREQARYAYLRVLFDPEAPGRSWQVWDSVAEDRGFPYPAEDLPRLYEITCPGDAIEAVRAD